MSLITINHCSVSVNAVIPCPRQRQTSPGEELLETEVEAGTPVPDGKEGAELTAVAEGG